MNFNGKVVVITGAGSGMGRAYAREFGRLGARLALNDFDSASLQESIELLAQTGVTDVCSAAFDVSDRAAMFAFAEQVQTHFGRVDIVINNAGVEGSALPAWDLPASAFERTMRINFFGVVHGTQAFLPLLLAQGNGHVVNVSSIFGLVGTPNHSDYCASKFAVRGFTEALMTELQESDIQVHLVHPGGIATNIQRAPASAAFGQHFLTTSPDDMARHLVKCLARGQVKVVYGNDALKTWLGSNLVPLAWLNRIIWREIRPVLDLASYRKVGVAKG